MPERPVARCARDAVRCRCAAVRCLASPMRMLHCGGARARVSSACDKTEARQWPFRDHGHRSGTTKVRSGGGLWWAPMSVASPGSSRPVGGRSAGRRYPLTGPTGYDREVLDPFPPLAQAEAESQANDGQMGSLCFDKAVLAQGGWVGGSVPREEGAQ